MDKHLRQAMLQDMSQGVLRFLGRFEDRPDNLSGWGHNYFCEKDGGRLIFTQDTPTAHQCPVCQHVYTEEKYNKAWIYLNRVQSIQEMQKAAYLYAETQESDYRDLVLKTISYYVDNYPRFVLHEKDNLSPVLTEGVPGAGKITPQGLNEAQVLVKIMLTLDMLKDQDAVSDDYLLHVKETMFRPAIEAVLTPQLNRVHNIKAWIDAAIGMAGIFFNEPSWLTLAFDGEFNIFRQLKEGVTSDNFWYEGSIHYHFFMLEGTVALFYFCKKFGVNVGDETIRQIPKAMLLEAYNYAFDDGIFPNPNDGWPDINLKTYLNVYYMASYVYDEDDKLSAIISSIRQLKVKRAELPLWDPYGYEGVPLEALLFDVDDHMHPADPKPSVLYPASNFAILRQGGVNLFLKYGHNGPSHAHPDKMTFELTVDDVLISRDLSNAGYGAEICNEWHRVSSSHNTVVVDGQNHTNTEGGQVLSSSEAHVEATATAAEGIQLTRRFELGNGEIHDAFAVNTTDSREHVFDHFMHVDGEIAHPTPGTPASLNFNENGYQHIKNVQEVTDRAFTLTAGSVRLELTVDEDAQVFTCETLDNPVTKYRQALVIRKRGQQATFNATYRQL